MACFKHLSGDNGASLKHLVLFGITMILAVFDVRGRGGLASAIVLAPVVLLSSDLQAPAYVLLLGDSGADLGGLVHHLQAVKSVALVQLIEAWYKV